MGVPCLLISLAPPLYQRLWNYRKLPWRMEEMRQKSREGALKLARQRNCNSFHPLCFAGWLTHHTEAVAVSEGSLSLLLSECYPQCPGATQFSSAEKAVPAVALLMHLSHQPREVPGPAAQSRECITLCLFLFVVEILMLCSGYSEQAGQLSHLSREEVSIGWCCVLSSLFWL